MKRPSFQFYPSDWLRDAALRVCSLAGRGLWADMLCIMHQGIPYGHLTLPLANDFGRETPKEGSKDAGKGTLRPILPLALARIVGGSVEEVQELLNELEAAGVFSRTADGVIFSRRMVKDEKLRETRAAYGIQSLNNPSVPRPKARTKDTSQLSLPPSPSSSSSSSSSTPSLSEPQGSDKGSGSLAKRGRFPSTEGVRLAGLLKAAILRNNHDARITPSQETKWAVEADRMMSLDGRTEVQIEELIAWSQQDSFWCANILSMNKLRQKFDQLTIKRRSDSGLNHNSLMGPQGPDPHLPTSYVPASQHMRKTIEEERETNARAVRGGNA